MSIQSFIAFVAIFVFSWSGSAFKLDLIETETELMSRSWAPFLIPYLWPSFSLLTLPFLAAVSAIKFLVKLSEEDPIMLLVPVFGLLCASLPICDEMKTCDMDYDVAILGLAAVGVTCELLSKFC